MSQLRKSLDPRGRGNGGVQGVEAVSELSEVMEPVPTVGWAFSRLYEELALNSGRGVWTPLQEEHLVRLSHLMPLARAASTVGRGDRVQVSE